MENEYQSSYLYMEIFSPQLLLISSDTYTSLQQKSGRTTAIESYDNQGVGKRL